MGLFRKKNKVKIYTLEKAMEILKKEGYEDYIAVPVDPSNTRFWVGSESERQAEFDIERARVKENRKKENKSNSAFGVKRNNFMEKINYEQMKSGRNLSSEDSHDIKYSSSNRPGRVLPSYNNYKSARNYQKRYGDLSR